MLEMRVKVIKRLLEYWDSLEHKLARLAKCSLKDI
jgi:hypothetical protein